MKMLTDSNNNISQFKLKPKIKYTLKKLNLCLKFLNYIE